jgi:hypothetical protein
MALNDITIKNIKAGNKPVKMFDGNQSDDALMKML